jgi:hypothetical protein
MAPQMCRSTNRQVDPEVWFRIVHLAQDGLNCALVAAYREQTVEIALGPKGAFENGNVGALTRRVAADKVVRAAPPSRGNPKPPREPRTPQGVELLRKGIGAGSQGPP